MVGIYKITSPSGGVYIGQSWDIQRRIRDHRLSKKKSKIHSSIIKYGWDVHEMKVVHALPNDINQETLDSYEIFYITLYKQAGVRLLNLRDGGRGGLMSEESKRKMSIAKKGVPGTKHTEAMKQYISMCAIRQHKIMSEENKKARAERLSKSNSGKKGRPMSDTQKQKMTEGRIRYEATLPFRTIRGLTPQDIIKIKSTKIERKYGHFRMLAKQYNVHRSTICDILSGRTHKHVSDE